MLLCVSVKTTTKVGTTSIVCPHSVYLEARVFLAMFAEGRNNKKNYYSAARALMLGTPYRDSVHQLEHARLNFQYCNVRRNMYRANEAVFNAAKPVCASVILRTPIVGHIVRLIGAVGASRATMDGALREGHSLSLVRCASFALQQYQRGCPPRNCFPLPWRACLQNLVKRLIFEKSEGVGQRRPRRLHVGANGVQKGTAAG